MQPSPERLRFNELLKELKSELKPGSIVYDLGKSIHWDYRPFFHGFKYKTIDCDGSKGPDYVMDIEVPGNALRVKSADALIVHGVLEQCNDPVKMIHGALMLLKPGGKALFGLISVGYPLYDNDRIRITPCGVKHYLKDLKITREEPFYRNQNESMPTYIFVKGEK